jgi:hypothetical protein
VSLRETHGKVVNGRLCLAAPSGYFFLSCALFDARQTALAVRAIQSARQRFFTMQLSAMYLLPCVFQKNARQRLCIALRARQIRCFRSVWSLDRRTALYCCPTKNIPPASCCCSDPVCVCRQSMTPHNKLNTCEFRPMCSNSQVQLYSFPDRKSKRGMINYFSNIFDA